MRHVYLDTNVLLAFYGLSSEDLEELRKLVELVRRRDITLYLPQQTEEEFARNLPGKVAEALRRLKSQRLTLEVPQLARPYPAFAELRSLQRKLDSAHAALVSQVEADAKVASLKADTVVSDLFALATKVPTTPDLLAMARTRHELRHPPGKADSLGDALNWETLLQSVPESVDLVFVTDDGDYASPIQADAFHPYLISEWQRRKRGTIVFYRRLTDFLAHDYPAIALAADIRRDAAIAELSASRSFADTHSAINRVKTYVDFSVAQRNDILRAAVANSQIAWIILDDDVYSFMESIVRGHEDKIDPDILSAYRQLVKREQDTRIARAEAQAKAAAWLSSEDDDDLPF